MHTEETTEKREKPRNTTKGKTTKKHGDYREGSRELRCRNDHCGTVRYDLWEVVIQHWLKLIYVSFVPRYLNPTNEIPKPQYLRDHLKRRMRRQ